MLADGQHLQPADIALVDVGDELLHRRHEAVFHPRPEHRPAPGRLFRRPAGVVDGGAQGLFAQDRPGGLEQGLQHPAVGVVGGDDQHGVQLGVGHHGLHRLEFSHAVGGGAEGLAGEGALFGDGITDGRDPGVGEQFDVANMLATHHANADESDPKRFHTL